MFANKKKKIKIKKIEWNYIHDGDLVNQSIDPTNSYRAAVITRAGILTFSREFF